MSARVSPAPVTGPQRQAEVLAEIAQRLAGEFRLRPLLERVLHAAVDLLGCTDGSISLADHAAGTYRKEVDVGVACASGRTFPLTEGITGAVVSAAAPVCVAEYAQVSGGHLGAADRARLHAAVGVPVRWGASVLGAVVVFSADPDRCFEADDVELLTLFARHAAIAITTARLHTVVAERGRAEAAAREREQAARRVAGAVSHHVASVLVHLELLDPGDLAAGTERRTATGPRRSGALDHLTRARAAARTALVMARSSSAPVPDGAGGGGGPAPSLPEAVDAEVAWLRGATGIPARLVVAGDVRPVSPDVADHLLAAVRTAVLHVVVTPAVRTLRVGLVHGADEVVLLVEDDGTGDVDAELEALAVRTRQLGGSGEVQAVPGWGTRLRLSMPYRLAAADAAASAAPRTGVLVVDGRPAVRAGLTALLELESDLVRVLGDVGRAQDVADAVDLLRPDVVVLGAHLGDGDPDAVAADVAARPAAPAVVVLDDADPPAADPTAPARGGGAAAVPGARWRVPADVTAPELLAVVLRAARAADGAATGPGAARPAADDGDLHPRTPAATPREEEVLHLLEQGRSDREIAAELVIARKTVEKHVGSLLRKHGVHSRGALIAVRSGALARP